VLDAGAEARVDTQTAQAPVIGYVRSQAGFMANLSIDGTKFNKLKL
jgi:lipid-binding SYLF domain-containing protein